MQLVGFITKKFVTMHGHVNVKYMKIVYMNIRHQIPDWNRALPVTCGTT